MKRCILIVVFGLCACSNRDHLIDRLKYDEQTISVDHIFMKRNAELLDDSMQLVFKHRKETSTDAENEGRILRAKDQPYLTEIDSLTRDRSNIEYELKK